MEASEGLINIRLRIDCSNSQLQILARLDLGNATVQNMLLACAPQQSSGQDEVVSTLGPLLLSTQQAT